MRGERNSFPERSIKWRKLGVDDNNPSKVLTVVGEKDNAKALKLLKKVGYKAAAPYSVLTLMSRVVVVFHDIRFLVWSKLEQKSWFGLWKNQLTAQEQF